MPDDLTQARMVREWNERHPIGTPVTVTLDGETFTTRTRSSAILQRSQTALIWVEGIAGSVELAHVEARVTDADLEREGQGGFFPPDTAA